MPMIAVDIEHPNVACNEERGVVAGEAVRYFVASLAALLLDSGLLFIGVRGLGLPAWAAGALAYGAGLVLIYRLSICWVFRHRANRTMQDKRGEFMAFAVLGLVGLVLNSATLHVATGSGLALPLAKILSAAIGFVANFVSRKWLLFSKTTQ